MYDAMCIQDDSKTHYSHFFPLHISKPIFLIICFVSPLNFETIVSRINFVAYLMPFVIKKKSVFSKIASVVVSSLLCHMSVNNNC